MEVKVFKLKEIKLLSEDVVDVEQYCNVQPILPAYGKEGDACMDVYPIHCEYDKDKDRCCQLIINSAQRITWKEVKSIEELGESERGNKGFGEGTGGAAKA